MGGARSPSPNAIEENKAFVRGLTEDCNEEMITQVFSKYGRVTEGLWISFILMLKDFSDKLKSSNRVIFDNPVISVLFFLD